jgi:hypothetical protein
MLHSSAGVAGIDARQSMIRVWMALSAVWVAFWLLIAAIVLATVRVRYSVFEELGPFALIVLTPPVALLGVGALVHMGLELWMRVRRFRR